jgi:multidrug efflux pump subunit AcrA (membrane-fusion protein)
MDIVNKDERLKLGMSAKLNILVDTHTNVLAVPYDAIEEKDGGQTVIYVAQKEAKPENPEDGQPVIQVFGEDGLLKNTGDKPSKPDKNDPPGKMRNAKEIPVQIGLESDYYTAVISPDIYEGMTVLVNSTAGEIRNDMEMFMGL